MRIQEPLRHPVEGKPHRLQGVDASLEGCLGELISPHFFSQLFAGPMTSSLGIVFAAGVVMSLVAALASALRQSARVEVVPSSVVDSTPANAI